jgi:polynucleotide 5'-kinase involved in rRNA processing
MLLKVYEYKQAAEKVLRERKELAKTAQRRVFQHSKISNVHLEHPGYTTLHFDGGEPHQRVGGDGSQSAEGDI